MSEQNKAGIRRLIDVSGISVRLIQPLFAPEAVIYESEMPLPGTGPAVVKKGIRAVYAASGQPHHNR
jgi:hypothetical protein